MEYCGNCKDREECRATGCSNPRRHPMQKDVTQTSRNTETMRYEGDFNHPAQPEFYGKFVRLRWSDHHAAAVYLEVQTTDGWQTVYPLIERITPSDEHGD